MESAQDNILSISEITGQIKQTLETDFDDITIKGEISNFKQHSSGHRYFSLKDENAQISATMWKFKRLNFLPEDGMKVIAKGSISVYPPRGSYQISVDEMKPDGLGELYFAYEKLKSDLESKGWFDEDLKKDIPKFPKKIGVATSPTGAAIRDILSTIERRYPLAEILLRPTNVQGQGSELDIRSAIEELNNSKVDVIISGRGGGSIEDLWSYNTIEVAEAIFNSAVPVISAVGHETDFTISDFVSDLRAATPTAAAELATPVTSEYLQEILDQHKIYFQNTIKDRIEDSSQKTDFFKEGRALRILEQKVVFESQNLDLLEKRLNRILNFSFETKSSRFKNLMNSIKLLDPKLPLEKGYALLKLGDNVISNKDSLGSIKEIEIIRNNETAKAKITKILPKQIL